MHAHITVAAASCLPVILSQRYSVNKCNAELAADCDTVWNALPAELRSLKSKDTFKRHLKTHYFKLAFQH